MQRIILQKIRRTVSTIAESMGATADVNIDNGYPLTFNDPELTNQMLPTLIEVAGNKENVILTKPLTGAEDFSFYAKKVPGLFFLLGGMPVGMDPANAPEHHTPDFYIDDKSMLLGVRTFCYLALDYMATHSPQK